MKIEEFFQNIEGVISWGDTPLVQASEALTFLTSCPLAKLLGQADSITLTKWWEIPPLFNGFLENTLIKMDSEFHDSVRRSQ